MIKGKNLIPFLIAGVVCILGITSIIFGTVKALGYAPLEPTDLCEKNVGTSLHFSVRDGLPAQDEYFLAFIGEEEEEVTSVMIVAPKEHESFIGRTECESVSVIGTLDKCDEEIAEKGVAIFTDYFDTFKSAYEQNNLDTFDEDLKNAINTISPYYLSVTDVKENDDDNLTGVGIALIVISVLTVVLYLLRNIIPVKKILLITAAVVVALAAVVFIIFKDRIRTLSSLTEVSDGFYTMTCYGDYDIDEYLNADISTNNQLVEWLSKKFIGFGYDRIYIDNFGCSSFICESSDGSFLMGRNFDYSETDSLLLYSEPDDGYASIGMVDLEFFGMGEYSDISPDSFEGKLLMLAAPYICMDGANEEGLGVSILQLDTQTLHQDKGNPDLMAYSAIRCILDKCKTVDEATELLENYDIHSGLDCSFHFFIADKSGKSLIVEWLDNEMVITEDTAVTNFVLAKGKYHLEGEGIDRYDIMKEGLDNSTLDKRKAMLLLSDLQYKTQTEWSCVYNLSDFSVDICLDSDYEYPYSFTRDDFR